MKGWRVAAAGIGLAGMLAGADTVACPAETNRDGKAYPYVGISVLNVGPKGQEYDLVPDDGKDTAAGSTQIWYLKDYRSMKVVLRCRYRGTEAVIDKEVPAPVAQCAQTFRLDRRGEVVGRPAPGGCR